MEFCIIIALVFCRHLIVLDMADPVLSSDLEAEASRPREMAPTGSKAKAKIKVPRALRVRTKASSAKEKDALRRHKALEKQFEKAKQGPYQGTT